MLSLLPLFLMGIFPPAGFFSLLSPAVFLYLFFAFSPQEAMVSALMACFIKVGLSGFLGDGTPVVFAFFLALATKVGPLGLLYQFKDRWLFFSGKKPTPRLCLSTVFGYVGGYHLLLAFFVCLWFQTEDMTPLFTLKESSSQIDTFIKKLMTYSSGIIVAQNMAAYLVSGALTNKFLPSTSLYKALSFASAGQETSPLYPKPTPFSLVALPFSFWIVLVLAGVLALPHFSFSFFGWDVGLISMNLLIVLYLCFLVQGMSVLSLWFNARGSSSGVWLLFGLSIIISFINIGIMILGIFEPWLKHRHYAMNNRSKQ